MFEAPRFKHDLMFDRWGGDLSNILPETGFKHPQVSLRSSRKSEFPKNDENVKNACLKPGRLGRGGLQTSLPPKNDKNVKNRVSGMFEAGASGAGVGASNIAPPQKT